MTKDIRFLHVGVGGFRCGCCFPVKRKLRVQAFRAARRRATKEWRKMEGAAGSMPGTPAR